MTGTSVGKRFGIIQEDQQRAMSGLEFVQGLVDWHIAPEHDGASPRL